MVRKFEITQYPIDERTEYTIIKNHRDFLSWPIVYFLKNQTTKDAYVGETTDVLTRLKTHAKTARKQHLSSINLILSELFNKSATLDIEANLIRYISADGYFTLQNGNLGIANHKFYQQKEVYWNLFKGIWGELRACGVARHSLEHINNSDLFKYSPYKTLSREQVAGLKMILSCILDDQSNVSLIHGGAGTGKSIVAIFLFKLLKTRLSDFNFADFDDEDEELFSLVKDVKHKYGDLNMALVIPMASFRKTISKVFQNIKGLSSNMVIGPSETAKHRYDLLVVDEGHRLRRRVNLGSYFGTFDKNSQLLGLDKFTSSELNWVVMQSKKSVIFYDESQSIKPSDVLKTEFHKLQEYPGTRVERLKTQFRVKGGNKYVDFVYRLFSENTKSDIPKFTPIEYEFCLYENLHEMIGQIRLKESSDRLSRLIAGFAWEWVSNKDAAAYDIVIGDSKLRWNSVAIDWVNTAESVNEVGCIHTTQGYDLNYAGVIIGPELDYDFAINEFIVYKDRYKDKNGKNAIKDPRALREYVLNIYKTIFLRGIRGTFVYVCNENLRKHLAQYIPAVTGEKHGTVINLKDYATEGTIPFYDLKISAGTFSGLQSVENVKYIDLEGDRTNIENYFACQVVGESMNKVIPNGAVCLFQKYTGGSRSGLITLVESDNFYDSDYGANYTIKEYSSKKTISEDGWHHEEIVLLPRSTDTSFKPIVLTDEEVTDLRVIGIFVKVLVGEINNEDT